MTGEQPPPKAQAHRVGSCVKCAKQTVNSEHSWEEMRESYINGNGVESVECVHLRVITWMIPVHTCPTFRPSRFRHLHVDGVGAEDLQPKYCWIIWEVKESEKAYKEWTKDKWKHEWSKRRYQQICVVFVAQLICCLPWFKIVYQQWGHNITLTFLLHCWWIWNVP